MGCQNSTKQKNSNNNNKEHDEILGNQIPKAYIANNDTRLKDISIQYHKNNNDIEDVQDNVANKQRGQKKQNQKIRAGNQGDDVIHENIQKEQKQMSKKDLQMLMSSLKGHFLFNALSDSELEVVVQSMYYCVNSDEYVFKQGFSASSYFIIDQGQVQILINNEIKKTLQSGQGFGELALLYNAQRSASVKCLGKCAFWAIDRGLFRKTVEDIVLRNYESNRQFMESVNFFKSMNTQQKDSIASGLINIKYDSGQFIVNEGDSADSFYMIKEGTVSVWQNGKVIRKLGKGDSFGEQALYVSSKRVASVKAETQIQLLSLGRQNLCEILGDQIQNVIFNNVIRWSFDKSQLFKQLTKIQIEKIMKVCKKENYKKDEIIYEKDKLCEKIVIVLEGGLVDNTGQQVTSKGNIFGDIYLQKQNVNNPIKYQIKMQSDGVLAVIETDELQRAIGGEIEKVIKKNENNHEKKMTMLVKKADYSHILLENLIFIKKLGSGQFGNVYLIADKDNNQLYALKSVSKAQIIQQQLEQYVIQEKNVLQIVDFPFIMKFIKTFKDNQSVYFLVEFISGMELFDVIRDMNLLTSQDSQFYIGTLLLCLEYLHSKQIIYRDLKPENIMVDSKGIMYLIDLGTCKFLDKGKHIGRTFTIIGTPHYMAPEIIQGKGYSYAVDLWSLGVCLYEFMCGGLPYAEDADDPYEIYEEIIKTNLKYPSFMKDKQAIKLINQLLSKGPEARLGGSFAALKAHPWFDNFSWDDLYNQQIKPPYIPPQKKIVNVKLINDQIKVGKTAIQQIKSDQAEQKLVYKKELAKNQNWDKDF